MKQKLYQIDAFTDRLFSGNPAAVCPLDKWLDDATLQAIAAENNLSETAFFVPAGDQFQLRWFTPLAEVDLCGHATLAAAWVMFHCLQYPAQQIRFATRSGILAVARAGAALSMDFPARPPRPCAAPPALIAGLGSVPREVLAASYYIVRLDSAAKVQSLAPDLDKFRELDLPGVCVTAPGEDCDFVSRFFAPKLGVDEDPVTGSAHCELAPYWAPRLGKQKFVARQLSRRGGTLHCALSGERVILRGTAVLYMQGEIELGTPT